MAAMMGGLYSKLFNTDVQSYLPFVTVGLIVWQFIAATVNESCLTFVAVSAEVQQVRLPFSSHVFRLVYRNLLVLAHNVVILPVVLAIFPPPLTWGLLTLIPALIVLSINAAWLACLLGMLGARYRDLPPIISNFLQALFFVTPIFWRPEALGRFRMVARYNPLHAAIDIIRGPILGCAPDSASWPIMLGMTAVGCAITFAVFARFRGRIAYWV
jgi:ABC-type polysaccharide/polyol phosphate export permease